MEGEDELEDALGVEVGVGEKKLWLSLIVSWFLLSYCFFSGGMILL